MDNTCSMCASFKRDQIARGGMGTCELNVHRESFVPFFKDNTTEYFWQGVNPYPGTLACREFKRA